MSVRWLRGNRSDAEDVVSFAALKALDFLERHPAGVQQFRPWALRIVRNLCADVRRQRMRRSELSADTEVSDEVADRPSSEVAPDRALLRHELIPALDDAVEPVAPGAVASATVTAPQLSDEELLAALRAHDWQITATARHLGIARNTLYARMRRCGVVRRARDISREDLVDVYRRHGGDLAVIAEALNVSLRGLQLRLRELGLIA